MPPERRDVVDPNLRESEKVQVLIALAANTFKVPRERLAAVVYLITHDQSLLEESTGSSSGILYVPHESQTIEYNGIRNTITGVRHLLNIKPTDTVYMARYLGYYRIVEPTTLFVRKDKELEVHELFGTRDRRHKTIFYSTTDRRNRGNLIQTAGPNLLAWRTVIPIDENGLEFSTHEELEDVGENSRKGISPYTSFGGCLRPTRSKDAPLFVEWIKEEIVNLTPYNFS